MGRTTPLQDITYDIQPSFDAVAFLGAGSGNYGRCFPETHEDRAQEPDSPLGDSCTNADGRAHCGPDGLCIG